MSRGANNYGYGTVQKRPRRYGLAFGILALVVIVVFAVGWLLSQSGQRDILGGDDTPGPIPEQPMRVQPADCADTSLVSVPGTWESSATDDPFNPQANPESLLLKITKPLVETTDPGRLEAYTVPYTAQFRNPQAPAEMTYDASRLEGTDKARAKLVEMHARCPYTSYVLIGFSQGAVIAGDLTAEIGTGVGPVPPELLKSSILISDGRRDLGSPGPGAIPSNGQGMEISLLPFSGITQFIAGATMTGPRVGGFGAVADRTASICAAPDLICNAPLGLTDGAARLGEFINNNAVHAQYDSNPDVIAGATATAWAREHIAQLVADAEEIAHP